MTDNIEKAPTTEESIREFMKQFRMLQNEIDNVRDQQKGLTLLCSPMAALCDLVLK